MNILLLIFLFLQYFVTGQKGTMNNQNSFLFSGYKPNLYNGPNNCCKHNVNWDDEFTLMCQTCAYDVINKKKRGLTYKYLKNNITKYEITCSKLFFNVVQCKGNNYENGGQPKYQANCDDSCIPNIVYCNDYQSCNNNEITLNNEGILMCTGNDNFICNNTKIKCGQKDCNILTHGNGENILNNVIIDGKTLDENSNLVVECLASGANDCKNIEIICPKKENTICRCSGCDYSTTKLHCYHGSGVKCSGGSIVEYWDANNIWCKGSILGNAICNDENETLMQCRGYGNYYSNLFPPNNKCVASREVMFHNGQKYERILVGSCGKMVNNSFVYSLPKCFNYLSKPGDIPTMQELLTKIITYNNTIYNTSKCFEDPYMCGEMPCKYCNDVGCCTSDPTGHHCKTKNPYAKDCPEPKPCNNNKPNDETDDEFNFFNLKFKQIYVVYASLGLAGLCTFACSFYFAWHCYLRDKIKDILNDYLCCGLGEYILCICDFIGCCNKDEEDEAEEAPVRRRIRRQITRQMSRQTTPEARDIIDSPKHQTVIEMSNIKTESPRRRIINRAFI
jgi:hypothetical protein